MLRIAPGPPVVPGTSENAEIYKITNAGHSRCTTDGYPDIRLRDAAQRSLRFAYQDGGGAYVTRAKPAPVRLAPGSSAYLLVAQEECPTATNARPSTTIAVRIPGQHGAWLTTKTRTTFGGFARCPGGGPGPNTISISPISRNFRALP